MKPNKVDARFYFVLAAAAIFTFVAHEAGHWLAGRLLGYDMAIGFNAVSAAPGARIPAGDLFAITAAGPAVTVIQALLAYALIRSKDFLLAYPFLYVACFMRLAAAFVSLFNPNDEASLSLQLGWGQWLLPAMTVVVLLALTWAGARRLRLGWATNAWSYALCSLLFAVIVFGDVALRSV